MSRFFNIQTDAEGVCTIFLYGDIGDYYEVQSGRVARELLEAEKAGSRIHVRINSNGGDVYCGSAIYNAIKNSKADVHIYVDGIAASMASVVSLRVLAETLRMDKTSKIKFRGLLVGVRAAAKTKTPFCETQKGETSGTAAVSFIRTRHTAQKHGTHTVGFGISPNQRYMLRIYRSRAFTAGGESHPALKQTFCTIL